MTSEETITAHQTNCVSKKVSGLAEAIFKKWAHADTYKHRQDHSNPGSTIICDNRKDQRLVVNLNV